MLSPHKRPVPVRVASTAGQCMPYMMTAARAARGFQHEVDVLRPFPKWDSLPAQRARKRVFLLARTALVTDTERATPRAHLLPCQGSTSTSCRGFEGAVSRLFACLCACIALFLCARVISRKSDRHVCAVLVGGWRLVVSVPSWACFKYCVQSCVPCQLLPKKLQMFVLLVTYFISLSTLD